MIFGILKSDEHSNEAFRCSTGANSMLDFIMGRRSFDGEASPAQALASIGCESISMHANEVVGERRMGDDIFDRRHVARNASFGRIYRARSRLACLGQVCRL